MAPPIIPIQVRVLDKYIPEPNSGCWLWIGSLDYMGYGVITTKGRSSKRSFAHRVLYEMYNGPIPPGLELDHKCRVPQCCNPDHLEAVTHQENVRRGLAMNNGYWHRAKTHCPQGHPYDEANVRLKNGKWRVCRACAKAQDRTRRSRNNIIKAYGG